MKRFSTFQLFNSHLDLAHNYWKKTIASLTSPTPIIIDATCGNGHDTLFLSQACSESKNQENTRILAMDKQTKALESAHTLLKEQLSPQQLAHIEFHLGCHSQFPTDIQTESVALIVYNLGYLPGGDKAITTLKDTTLQSLQSAIELVCPGGLISITCYPGHAEGKEEEARILEFMTTLHPAEWSCCHHRWLNRKASPSLVLMQKAL